MKHKDELDEILRRGANGPDGDLADLLMQMQSAGLASAPVPSRSLAAVLLAPPVDMLTPQDLARSPRLGPRTGRRTRLVGRLAAMAPVTKLLLAGSVAAVAVIGSVIAVDELSQDRRLRLDVVTPASPATSSPATSSPATSSPATSSPAASSPTVSSRATSERESSSRTTSSTGSTARTPRSTDASSPSTRSGSPSPRPTSQSPQPAPSTRSESSTATETTHPEVDPSTSESNKGRGGATEEPNSLRVEESTISVDER